MLRPQTRDELCPSPRGSQFVLRLAETGMRADLPPRWSALKTGR